VRARGEGSEHSGLLLRRYPATYLHGAALSSGWAVANCVSSYGGEPVIVPTLSSIAVLSDGCAWLP
jgi:hypothetical protein